VTVVLSPNYLQLVSSLSSMLYSGYMDRIVFRYRLFYFLLSVFRYYLEEGTWELSPRIFPYTSEGSKLLLWIHLEMEQIITAAVS